MTASSYGPSAEQRSSCARNMHCAAGKRWHVLPTYGSGEGKPAQLYNVPPTAKAHDSQLTPPEIYVTSRIGHGRPPCGLPRMLRQVSQPVRLARQDTCKLQGA